MRVKLGSRQLDRLAQASRGQLFSRQDEMQVTVRVTATDSESNSVVPRDLQEAITTAMCNMAVTRPGMPVPAFLRLGLLLHVQYVAVVQASGITTGEPQMRAPSRTPDRAGLERVSAGTYSSACSL